MAIYKGGKSIKGVYHQGRTIKGVYHQGRQVWGKEAEVLPVYGVQLEALTGDDALWLEYALEHGTVDMTVGGQVLRVAGDTTGMNAGRYDENLLLWNSVAVTTAQVAVNAYVEVHVSVQEELVIEADSVSFSEYKVESLYGYNDELYSLGIWRFESAQIFSAVKVLCVAHSGQFYTKDDTYSVSVTLNGNTLLDASGTREVFVSDGGVMRSAKFTTAAEVSGHGDLLVSWRMEYVFAKGFLNVMGNYESWDFQADVKLVYPAGERVFNMRVTSLVL